MFPIELSYSLSASAGECSPEKIHSLLPELAWGDESDLLKHSDDWPEAVATIRNRNDRDSDGCSEFPVEVDLPRFPGRVNGADAIMLPTKLALLRNLAAFFECRVLCRSHEFCREEDGVPPYSIHESLLCLGGRVFCASIAAIDARDGAKPAAGWIPLDDLPAVSLDASGALVDRESAISAVAEWIEHRDQSHLHNTSIIYPEPPEPDLIMKPEPEPEEISPACENFEQQDGTTQYLARLDQWEQGFETTASKQLIEGGISLPDPESLSDEELPGKLWSVIHGLRANNTFLYSTNHLSDRELYTWLWNKGLNEGIMDLRGLTDCGMHLDLLGSGDDESKNISLIYYDSAQDRADWFASWPDEPIPAHIDPPYDRDRHLPQRDY